MAHTRPVVISVTVVLLLVCRYYTAAQNPGDCSPSPPSFLVSSSGSLFSNNVPMINAQADILQPIVGGHRTDSWVVFSATQVQQHGLWCQVRLEDTNNMNNSDIGDWYYPTTDGYTLLPNTTTDNTPYQSLKCTNQIGLVVDGSVTNYQGIVKCNTTVPNLNRYENYFVVYDDNVFNNYSGPTVEPTMRVSILSSRDTLSNVVFTMSFNVTFGPPSRVYCVFIRKGQTTKTPFFDVRDNPSLSREVITSYYDSSQPDMTRVSVRVEQPIKEEIMYECEVIVEGRVNINSGIYTLDNKGSGITTVMITVVGTPTGVTASRTGYTSVLVAWTAPSPSPAGYEVFYQTSAGDYTRLSGGNTGNTELTLTGLSLGAAYYIFVVGFGEDGTPVLPSRHSQAAMIVLSSQIPQLPDMLSLTSTSSSIMVSWSSPEEFAADSYNVSYSCQNFCGSQQTSSDTVSGTATTHTISSLNAGSSCTVSVTAVFGSNTSNTVTNSTNTTSTAPTGAPEGLTSTSVKSRSLNVVWETVPCPYQGGLITGYRLHYSNGSDSYTVNIAGEGNIQYNLTGLTPFTNYSVQVAAVNDKGTGPYSTPLTVETLQDVMLMSSMHHSAVVSSYFVLVETVTLSDRVISVMQTSLILLPNTQSCECYDRYPIPNSSSSSVVVMVIGWVLFTITLIVCGIIITLLMWKMRQNTSNKTKSYSSPVNDGIYDNPVLPESEEMKMTECAAYDTHKPHYTDENKHVTTT